MYSIILWYVLHSYYNEVYLHTYVRALAVRSAIHRGMYVLVYLSEDLRDNVGRIYCVIFVRFTACDGSYLYYRIFFFLFLLKYCISCIHPRRLSSRDIHHHLLHVSQRTTFENSQSDYQRKPRERCTCIMILRYVALSRCNMLDVLPSWFASDLKFRAVPTKRVTFLIIWRCELTEGVEKDLVWWSRLRATLSECGNLNAADEYSTEWSSVLCAWASVALSRMRCYLLHMYSDI